MGGLVLAKKKSSFLYDLPIICFTSPKNFENLVAQVDWSNHALVFNQYLPHPITANLFPNKLSRHSKQTPVPIFTLLCNDLINNLPSSQLQSPNGLGLAPKLWLLPQIESLLVSPRIALRAELQVKGPEYLGQDNAHLVVRQATSLLSVLDQYSAWLEDSLLPQTVTRANREWLHDIFLVAVVASAREPALGDERVGILEVER